MGALIAIMRNRPFVRAFTEWFATVDLGDIMTFEPAKSRDAVEISFLVGGSALHGYAHAAGMSVSASWSGEVYDRLWDDDLVPVHEPYGWCCTLCSQAERAHFPTIEDLWADHLFAPLHEWVNGHLRPAVALEFYRNGGVTWALLKQVKLVGHIASVDLK